MENKYTKCTCFFMYTILFSTYFVPAICIVNKKEENGEGYSAEDHFLPHILNLYSSHATSNDFEIYAENATFEDPLMSAHGVKEIKSAFYSLPKVFSESKIVEYNITENTIAPGKREMLIDNKQYYKFMGKDINMISLIKLDIEGDKIVRHEDRWNKNPHWSRDTVDAPLIGRMAELMRRASMKMTHTMMGYGKD